MPNPLEGRLWTMTTGSNSSTSASNRASEGGVPRWDQESLFLNIIKNKQSQGKRYSYPGKRSNRILLKRMRCYVGPTKQGVICHAEGGMLWHLFVFPLIRRSDLQRREVKSDQFKRNLTFGPTKILLHGSSSFATCSLGSNWSSPSEISTLVHRWIELKKRKTRNLSKSTRPTAT